ncbi:universal stress protein [Halanaeroarchaeum sulfurireducens]|nr:universal stress protein [Halanaeroarchaeum sulfurireducens]
MSRILVPVDGSEHAENAFEYAVEHFPEDDIVALHVIELPEGYFAAFAEDTESLPQVEDAKERGHQILGDIESLAADLDAEVETEIISGNPPDKILSYVEDEDVDEIVIGSRGLSGVGRIMFGSVAEQVVRRSEVPVVVVH